MADKLHANTAGYVYFITEGDSEDANLKIGFSQSPVHRMETSLQIGNSRKLRLAAEYKAAYGQEQALHRILAPYATLSNEWFFPTPEARAMMRHVKSFYNGYSTEKEAESFVGSLISLLASGTFRRTA